MCLDTEYSESLDTGPEILTPHKNDFLLPTLKVKGDSNIFNKSTQEWASVPSRLCILENGINYREKDATDASEPNSQGVNPAATIYPSHTWLFWKKFPKTFTDKKSHELLKAKELFLLFIGWQASCLSLFFFWV